MKYLLTYESKYENYFDIMNCDLLSVITEVEFQKNRGYEKQEPWTNYEQGILQKISQRINHTAINLSGYSCCLNYKWGMVLMEKCKDEYYYVWIRFYNGYKDSILKTKFWKCDQFDSLVSFLKNIHQIVVKTNIEAIKSKRTTNESISNPYFNIDGIEIITEKEYFDESIIFNLEDWSKFEIDELQKVKNTMDLNFYDAFAKIKTDKGFLSFFKTNDEYFYVQIGLYNDSHKLLEHRFWKCDQFDSLLKFIKNINKIISI